jgi:PAS domain S-box-containing protein
MANSIVRELPVEPSVFLSTAPATRKNRQLAYAVVGLSLLFFLAAAPFASLQLPVIPAFIPVYQSTLAFCDLITAAILFTQYAILRPPALLVLACGYLFSALMAVVHMLSFPGLFSPAGLLGAGLQTTAWLYMFWHGVFPICVIFYAMIKDADGARLLRASASSILTISIATVVAAVVALTALATIGHGSLPVIMQGSLHTPLMIFVVSSVWVLSAGALLALWLRRTHSLLDLWLMVVMCVWVFDIALSAVLNIGRFDLGFYVGRAYGLLAAMFVLIVLLSETGVLYAQLVDMLAAERREHEREIGERRRLFDISVELILVTDLSGVFVQVSPSVTTLLGYQPEYLIGRSASAFIYADDLEYTRNEMRLVRRGRQTRSFVTRYVHKVGRLVTLAWIGAWSEETQQYSFIGHDMTEQLESEQMARAIIETSLDAFVQLDTTGTVLEWSPKAEEMFDWPRQAIIGRSFDEFIVPAEKHGAFAQRITQFLRDAEHGVSGERYEAPSLRRDGTRLDTEVSLTALRRRGGYVINCFIRDITAKIVAEEQFRQAQKMETVGQLTGGIAHDFNNMLTVITGTIDILGDAVADKPELAAIAKLIGEAADRGAELTRHLLAFARKQPLQPHAVNINTLIADSLKLVSPALGESIETEMVLRSDVSPALVDPSQLSSALLNLAINARDAMPNGGKLLFETHNVVLDDSLTNAEVRSGNYVLIVVSDNGTGIPETIRAKIFEPFFTTKQVGKGTSLGLSMVYGFVKQSGGHIQVYSEEGYGTTFKIYLPCAVAQNEQPAEELSESEIEGGNETILVVEDDPMVRTYVLAQLASLNYKTLSAGNGAEALAIANSGAQFDLLFTDVIMPGKMNGGELADEMAKRRPSLKVLFTSGYTQDAMVHHRRLDSGVLLLAKPYRKIELARMLRKAIDNLDAPPAFDLKVVEKAVKSRAM